MKLIPAIDLLDGRCVRLLHGDFNKVTHYPSFPAELAAQYAAAGAEWLHVVDLAASRDGAGADTSALFTLLGQAPQKVQTGGGVRDERDISQRLDTGAARVVIGSLSVTDSKRFVGWLQHFGVDKLVAALDIRIDDDGVPWPRTHGWTGQGDRNMWQLLDELAAGGLEHLLCTDISRDGALSGPNLDLYSEITRRYPDLQLQASGGVSSLADLRRLKPTRAAGVITGKALLEKRFDVAAALEALR
ncbi:MAG: 1-(5-phosphoribosyl)-5-[(5-phosphoribosylamino)methylideneamino] imidazole-4-carboxamide isomerase [Xanthomonadales bacterium]|nr:1-(5-phosphoribosyl)-5-[(5-phosphoribosylamino)methylideneamino] imidazole-4-carboxamide isomerase [Gammaproteobacteria bacterium]MBT8072473.1 1-(5-phosphoribosyl)-5-[(5-phosphoribosylamino)methylideneamino] imidazole-4-carboxamide isomerase [Gammaproteobacteria bacterium]NNK03314.1 1-(5-phosphoribosyl)-5-[(5-phosphoribosylamino)methylideneamino] imidazole-4-carboxamide isomerase [Xanthomonadales bacterium]NNK99043.1 1-(5-phosphoribosyl)-5-[(5-phosphoribosylamino)methylideneamino] imidazole-4